jgi:monoamine oxidase
MSFAISDDVVDVVVIGAGLAGLRTAALLSECGAISVRIVEARTRVGGRTWSETVQSSSDDDEEALDLGGQWLSASHRRVHKLCAALDVPLFDQYSKGDSLLFLGGDGSKRGALRFAAGSFPPLYVHELALLQLVVWRLDALARRVPAAAPWLTHSAGQLDHVSLQDWLDRFVPLDGVRQSVIMAARSVFLEEARHISFLWFLFYLRSAGSLAALIDVKGGAQEMRFVRGAQSLSTALLEQLRRRRNVTMSFGHAVTRISDYADASSDAPARVELANGEVVQCRRIVGALSPQLTAKIAFDPPCERQHLGENGMFSGTSIKFQLKYKTAWWRALNLSGEIVANLPNVVVCCTFDACTASNKHASLLGFISGDAARSASKQLATVEARRAAVETAIKALLPDGAVAEEVLEYRECNWSTEAFTDGCVNGTRPGGWLTHRRGVDEPGAATTAERPVGHTDISRPVGRVLWAGAECGIEWNGYMEGALESAENAAKQALERLRETSNARFVLDGTELQQLLTNVRPAQVPTIGSVMDYVYTAVDAIDEWQPRLRAPMLGAIAASWYMDVAPNRLIAQLLFVVAVELLRLVLTSTF